MPELIDILNEPTWDAFVAGRDGELFISRRWMTSLAKSFGFHFEAYVERDAAGVISAAIPFVRINDVRGERITSLPFSDYVVPLVPDLATWKRLSQPLIDSGVIVIVQTLADSIVADDDQFSVDGRTVRHSVALDASREDIVARFGQQPRRHIRKAEKAGLTFRLAESRDELRAFYDMHLGVRKYKHSLLCQPFGLFEALWDNFMVDGLGAVVLGFDGDTVAGGCLLLEAGDTLYYKYAASNPDYRSAGVSHGAMMGAIDHGLERGLLRLDLGRSDVDQPGLIDFKRRFGAVQSDLNVFCFEPPSLVAADGEASEMLGKLTALFVSPDVPDEITERAGDLVYRYFA